MTSLYDELAEKLRNDPSLIKRSGPRQDIGLLLFNARDKLHSLWTAADRCVRDGDSESIDELRNAVERLKPLFGERNKS